MNPGYSSRLFGADSEAPRAPGIPRRLAHPPPRKERSEEKHSEAWWRAMHMLEVLHERYLASKEKTPELFLQGSDILRRFLAEECGIPAPAETIHQIVERFRGHPLEREVEEVLGLCNKVMYDGQHPTPSERDGIIRELVALIGRLEQVECPMREIGRHGRVSVPHGGKANHSAEIT